MRTIFTAVHDTCSPESSNHMCYSQYLHNQRHWAQHETNIALANMPKIRAQADEHVSKCMKLYKRHSGSLSISEMMELSGFSVGEQNCCAKCAWIYRCIKSLGFFYSKGKTPPVPVDITVVNRTVSSMTSASLIIPLAKIIPKKVKSTRDRSGATQTKQVAALKKIKGDNIAFKHASSVYVREKAKKGRMSASSVSKMIKKEFNVHVAPQMIQRHAKNDNILAPCQSDMVLKETFPKGTL
jgi:hypothetical protein